jgi:hypothetical protein
MTTTNDLPPIPNVLIQNVLETRNKLVSKLLHLVDKKMTGSDFHEFVNLLHEYLPKDILRITVQDSVKDLVKKHLTKSLLFDTCWRLAGNLNKLLDQKPVIPWARQEDFEWIPAQVYEIQTVKKLNRLVHELTFQSLAGSIVPKKIIQYWSLKKTYYLSCYRNEKNLGFGFSSSHVNSRGEQQNKNLFSDIRQYSGLRCFLLVDPKKSQADPFVTTIGHSYATTNYNKRLIAGRDRTQTDCLKGHRNLECYHCPYGIDKCPLATHLKTYTLSKCLRCEKDAFFDPMETDRKDLCVNCNFEERKK